MIKGDTEIHTRIGAISDLKLEISWRFRFMGPGIQVAPATDIVWIDTGGHCASGIIDHHGSNQEKTCAAMLVVNRADLVHEHLVGPWLSAARTTQVVGLKWKPTIVTHFAPDFDAIAASLLAIEMVEKGGVPKWGESLAHYALDVDQGRSTCRKKLNSAELSIEPDLHMLILVMTNLDIDRDDPFLEFAVMDAGHVIRVTFGGRRHPDAATCPNCSTILDWTLGDYQCKCGLGSKLAQVRGGKGLTGPSRNAILAIEAARLMGAIVPVEYQNELTANPPDRTQVFNIAGRTIETRLAKNPESWRVGLTALAAPQIILALNARGIDGLDTSWLWDINYTELLGKEVICVGERKLDIAYRLSVQGIKVKTADSFAQAVSQFDNRSIEAVASYTAFQDLITTELGISAKRGVTR